MCKLLFVFSLLLLLIINLVGVVGKPQLPGFLGCEGLWGGTYSYPWNNCLYPSNPCCPNYYNRCCNNSDTQQKITKVTVYYETISTESHEFFYYQLYPIYKELGSKFNLHLVPYGQAEYVPLYPTGWSIRCRHGDTECLGNKIHACLLTKTGIPDMNKFEFIICTLNAWIRMPRGSTLDDVNSIAKECADKHTIDLSYINECLKLWDNHVLLPHKTETELIKRIVTSPNWVPAIVFNDVYKDVDQQKALVNFKEVLCSYLGSGTKGC